MQPDNRQGFSNGTTRGKRLPGAASDRHRMQPDNRRGSSDGTTRGKRLPGAASDRHRMQPDNRRGRDTSDILSASEGRPASGTHIRGALPAPLPRYRGIRPRDTAKQMRRSKCSAASIPSRAPGRFDTRPGTLRTIRSVLCPSSPERHGACPPSWTSYPTSASSPTPREHSCRRGCRANCVRWPPSPGPRRRSS